jgi:hypothetical protein
MGKTASAVIALIECTRCHGFRALSTCVCVNKNEEQNEKNSRLAAISCSRLALKQLIGVM